jgi:hypothetical protein
LGQIWADLSQIRTHNFFIFLKNDSRELVNARIFTFLGHKSPSDIGFIQNPPKSDLVLLLLSSIFEPNLKKWPLSEIGLEWASSQGRPVGETQRQGL